MKEGVLPLPQGWPCASPEKKSWEHHGSKKGASAGHRDTPTPVGSYPALSEGGPGGGTPSTKLGKKRSTDYNSEMLILCHQGK